MPANVTIPFQIEPGADVEEMVVTWGAFFSSLTHPTPYISQRIGDAVRFAIDTSFRTESNRFGPWWPLAPFTVEERLRQGFPGEHPILQRTRRLRSSYTNPSHPEHYEEFRDTVDGWEGEWGSMTPYASVHVLGDYFIPDRSALHLPDSMEDYIGRRITDAIRESEPR